MSVYDEKPWLSLYDQGQPAEIALEFTDALSMFRASVSRNPDGDIIRYFGGRITARELDELYRRASPLTPATPHCSPTPRVPRDRRRAP